jgi:hypothetical protein
MSLELILYSTSACHLCEQALVLVQPVLGDKVRLREIDISDSEELFQRYGLLIPVLRLAAVDAELHWPFAASDIEQLIKTR